MSQKLKTMTEIVRERAARAAARNIDDAAVNKLDERIRRRMENDPALGIVVAAYADSLVQVLQRFPPELHREFIRQCLIQAVVEWEDCSLAFDEQLKQTPII